MVVVLMPIVGRLVGVGKHRVDTDAGLAPFPVIG